MLTEKDRNKGTARRVLVVARWPVGGIRTHLLYTYPALLAAGYRFTFVGPADEAFRAFAREVGHWERATFHEAPLRGRHCRLRQTVRGLLRTERFDLVHSHGLTAGAQVALANLGLRVPHVLTSHDVYRPDQAAGFTGRLKFWLLGRLLRTIDVIVSVSADAHANLLAYLPALARSRGRLLTIPNGIDTDHFAAGAGSTAGGLRDQLGLGTDVCLMGFLGRFMEQKGFLPLLGAMELLAASGGAPAVHLVAVGSGDYEREYKAEVTRRGLSTRVTFLGAVADTQAILPQLDLLVVPSLWEAGPLLPMEALCLGVPVVGSDCIGLREILDGSPSRTVPAGDSTALSRALGAASAASWKEAARAYTSVARAKFSAVRSAEQLRRAFDGLLAGTTAGQRSGRSGVPPLLGGKSGGTSLLPAIRHPQPDHV